MGGRMQLEQQQQQQQQQLDVRIVKALSVRVHLATGTTAPRRSSPRNSGEGK